MSMKSEVFSGVTSAQLYFATTVLLTIDLEHVEVGVDLRGSHGEP